jgi:hypothetical protein
VLYDTVPVDTALFDTVLYGMVPVDTALFDMAL